MQPHLWELFLPTELTTPGKPMQGSADVHKSGGTPSPPMEPHLWSHPHFLPLSFAASQAHSVKCVHVVASRRAAGVAPKRGQVGFNYSY